MNQYEVIRIPSNDKQSETIPLPSSDSWTIYCLNQCSKCKSMQTLLTNSDVIFTQHNIEEYSKNTTDVIQYLNRNTNIPMVTKSKMPIVCYKGDYVGDIKQLRLYFGC